MADKKSKIQTKSVSLEIPADASDKEILKKIADLLKEYRTEAKLAKGQIVLNTEDKQGSS
jgi:hypothetical protein